MALSTAIKNGINSVLNRCGLHLDTMTAYRRESARLEALDRAGYFDAPAFPVPDSFEATPPPGLVDDIRRYGARFDDLVNGGGNSVGFSFGNGFFSSPDAEVVYCMIRRHAPRRVVEVGSGNSTKIIRLALKDGGLESELCSIDPQPRVEIDRLADRVIRRGVEGIGDPSLFSRLEKDDVLFIDSSHELRPGNDLTHLYLNVFPLLEPGVLVHIHDVFLPYDYPSDWVLDQRLTFAEQYLIQVMLQSGSTLDVLWPGYYLQRTLPGFDDLFPHRGGRNAQSLWLRVR